MNFFKKESSFFGIRLSDHEYQILSKRIEKENHENLVFLSGVLSGLSVPTIFVVFFLYRTQLCSWLYLSLMVCIFIVYFHTRFAGKNTGKNTEKNTEKNTRRNTTLEMYVFISILMGYSIVFSTIMNPNMMAVKYIAFILALPLFFTDLPVRIGSYIVGCTAVFIVSAVLHDSRGILVQDIVHACFFAALSIAISTYMSKIKIQRLYYEQKWKYISETDLMTGLNSRNLYERSLKSYADRCDRNLSCVFVDVNGLHEVDVEQGYEAGDRMLKCVAQALREQFGPEDTYRIGGDEFVAFVRDGDPAEIRQKVAEMNAQVEKEGFSVSVGVSDMRKDEVDMKTLTTMAEKEMGDVKRHYYEQSGCDRRWRK